MDFVFPKNVTNENGIIKVIPGKGNPQFINIENPLQNMITIENTDYVYTYMANNGRAKGGNSIILKLYESQKMDFEDVQYDEPDLILKISKIPESKFSEKSLARFSQEIEALNKCKEVNFQNIITIFNYGECGIYNKKRTTDRYMFYTMEYAEGDLKSFIEERKNISISEKIDLCLSLAFGLEELDKLGYYHRDLKPDNIFIVGDNWKIADLGLIEDRNKDNSFDYDNELIGPRGWLSPEAINKHLCYRKGFPFHHDCVIDHQSDIFQLGRIFCYILQNNNPIGVFKQKDLYINDNAIYQIVRTMLNYPKSRRFSHIKDVIRFLKPIQTRLLKQSA